MFDKINLAIVGAGRWGINHVKTAHQLLGKNLKLVCDFNTDSANKIKEIFPEINFTTDISKVISDKSINAVIVATPAETHYDIAMQMIHAGKHVMAEKPLTLTTDEARILTLLAAEYKVNLMVGHIMLFHPAVIKIKSLIKENKIGTLQYIYSNRLNLGSVRTEENILWSFAPHDISILQYLIESRPVSVDAKGAEFLTTGIEDTTITFLTYPNNIHAHIFVSWLHPFKEQRLVVIGNEGMLVFEDSIKSEKLKFYPKGFRNVDGVLQKFEANYQAISFDETQPLAEEQKHFFSSIENNSSPITDGHHAVEILEILEAAQAKLKVQARA